MPPGGWYRMHRGWMDNPAFRAEPFSRRCAWAWLIENAAWEDHVQWFNGHRLTVSRGELVVSYRGLAKQWKWTLQRVRTFLSQLQTDEKLTLLATQPATHLKLCNYEKYQATENSEPDANQHAPNTGATHAQHTTEEGKEGKEGKEINEGSARYAFFGRTIKVNDRDLDLWRTTYHAIPDIMAELTALDAWLQAQSDGKRKTWFHTVIGALNRKHQEILSARDAPLVDQFSSQAPLC